MSRQAWATTAWRRGRKRRSAGIIVAIVCPAMAGLLARAATPDDQLIFHENFEEALSESTWRVWDDDPANGTGHWDRVTCRSHYGGGSAWCMGSAEIDCSQYKDAMDARMELLPAIDLSHSTNPRLTYWRWYDLTGASGFQGHFHLYIRGDGSGWQEVTDEVLYFEDSEGWEQRVVSLPYKNDVRVQFQFVTFGTPSYKVEGIYVDDIEITGCPILGGTTLVSPGPSGFVCHDYSQPYCWEPVERASSYRIQWLTVEALPTVFDEGIATGTCYWNSLPGTGPRFWRVRAESSCSEGAWSEMRLLLLVDRPSEVVLGSPAPGQEVCAGVPQRFEWSPVSGAVGYTIQWDTSSWFFDPLEQHVSSAYADQSFPLSGVRHWRVAADNLACPGPWSATRTISVVGIPGQAMPSDPPDGATVCSGTWQTYSWSPVATATGYTVQWSAAPTFSSPVEQMVSDTSVQRVLNGLGTWYWRVRARNSCGDGAWSAARDVLLQIAPASPFLLSPEDGSRVCSGKKYHFCWQTALGAVTYRVQWDDDADFGSLEGQKTTTETCAETGFIGSGPRYWRVYAEGPCGTSAWSEVREVEVWSGPLEFGCTSISFLDGGNVALEWGDPGCPLSYTVEYATRPTDTAVWNPVPPEGQWPIDATSWTGPCPAAPSALFFRIGGE